MVKRVKPYNMPLLVDIFDIMSIHSYTSKECVNLLTINADEEDLLIECIYEIGFIDLFCIIRG